MLSEAKDRERRLVECRKTAEERKNYFESMERHMFATRSSVKVSRSLKTIFDKVVAEFKITLKFAEFLPTASTA